MKSIKAVLALLPSVVRAALLWFKLRNYLTYVQSLQTADHEITRLELAHRAAANSGDSDARIRLLFELDDARASREALSAAYLELAGGSAGADIPGDLHPGEGGGLAQPPVLGGSGIPADP